MLSFIRRQLSATNLMVVAALIFAMAGGAYAANGGGKHHGHHHGHAAKKHKGKVHHKTGYVITSEKQISKKVIKQLKGNRGPQGEKGAPGTNGTNGAPGAGVTIAALAAGNAHCALGGASFTGVGGPAFACTGANGKEGPEGKEGKEGKQGEPGEGVTVEPLVAGSELEPSKECEERGGAAFSNASTVAYACNGAEGTAATTLGSGESESGAWSVQISSTLLSSSKLYLGSSAVTYPVPLPEGQKPTVHYLTTTEGAKGTVSACPKPGQAEPGNLCLYAVQEFGPAGAATPAGFSFYEPIENKAWGTALMFYVPEAEGPNGVVFGTWTVTAK